MNPDQSIHIQLERGKGRPLRIGNVLLAIQFFTAGNYRYEFTVGRTDESGLSKVSYGDIEMLRSTHAKFFLMDYNTRLEDCDPAVRIIIPTEGELRRAFEAAVKVYDKPPDWARDWPQNSRVEASPQTTQLTGPVTNVLIPCKEL